MRFRAARAAYASYLDQGRIFLFARSLRRINFSTRKLLLDRGWMLPEELREHALALIAHYDVWLTLWDDLAERTSPLPSDPFVFENSFTYPREAEAALERLFAESSGSA
jgi:hypothetical protein